MTVMDTRIFAILQIFYLSMHDVFTKPVYNGSDKEIVIKLVSDMQIKNKKRIIILALALIFIIIATMAAFVILKNMNKATSGGFSYNPDENAKSWSGDMQSQSAATQDGIKIPGYGDIYFPKNTDTVSMTLYNPQENDCLFVFELYLDDAEKAFYTTGSIEPGDAVTEIDTNGGIDEGEHTLRIKILAFDAKTGASLNNAVVKTVLNVI